MRRTPKAEAGNCSLRSRSPVHGCDARFQRGGIRSRTQVGSFPDDEIVIDVGLPYRSHLLPTSSSGQRTAID